MTLKEFRELTKDMDENLPLAAMNVLIEDDGVCPADGVESVEVLENNEDGQFLSIQFKDSVYIDERYIDQDERQVDQGRQ